MKTIKVEDALRLQNVLVIDVRTESEHKEDNILNAFNIPLFKDNEQINLKTIKVEDALRLQNVLVIDVRTESEHKEDNILNAFNIPLFKDNEHNEVGTIYKMQGKHNEVGTIYKMQGKHEAIKKGFDYVSYKLKDIYLQVTSLVGEYDNIVVYCARGGMRSGSIVNLLSSLGFDYVSYKLKDIYLQVTSLVGEYDNIVVYCARGGMRSGSIVNLLSSLGIEVYQLEGGYKDLQVTSLVGEYDNIVVYCARGGMRSGSIVNLLSSLGIEVYQLEGGYKAYRNYVLDYLKDIMGIKNFIVVHGLTGVGKTDLLKLLENKNIDNIDLEGIAKNSGSTFGFITFDEKPPSQKKFETKIFERLFFSNSDYIFIESESKRVGHVLIPNEIYDAIVREGYHILLECSLENRVKRLCRDYVYDKDNKNLEVLKDCINKFRKRLGHSKVDEYINLLDEGKYEELVEKYLVEYYDPLYMHSVDKYTYNKIINFDDMNKGTNEAIKFHKTAMEGEIQC